MFTILIVMVTCHERRPPVYPLNIFIKTIKRQYGRNFIVSDLFIYTVTIGYTEFQFPIGEKR